MQAPTCNCPCCRAAKRTFLTYGFVVALVYGKKLRQRIAGIKLE